MRSNRLPVLLGVLGFVTLVAAVSRASDPFLDRGFQPVGLRAPDGGAEALSGNGSGAAQVTSSAHLASAHGEVLCPGAPTPDGGLPVPALIGGLDGRAVLAIQNLGAADISVCPDSACTMDNGWVVKAGGGTFSTDATDAISYHCVANGVDQVAGAGTRYQELR